MKKYLLILAASLAAVLSYGQPTPAQGVGRIVAGTNVTISPASGTGGSVTINAAGGSGTPGGSNGDLQYNNAGALGGIAPGAGVVTALGVNVGSAGAPVLFNGAGGTPLSITLTNASGTAASLTAGNVTTNANLTGHITSTGNASVLGSFSFSQLNTALTGDDAAGLAANNSFTGVNTFTGSFIRPPETVTVTEGSPDTAIFEITTADGNVTIDEATTIAFSAVGTLGQSITRTIINSTGGAVVATLTNCTPSSTTIAASSSQTYTFKSNGSAWVMPGGDPYAVWPAASTSITDTGDYYAGVTVEAALQEIGAGGIGGGSRAFTALSDGATITLNAATSTNGKVTLGGNRTLAITNATDGMEGALIVTQDGTGSRTLALPSGSKSPSNGLGAITLSTTAGYVDKLRWSYDGTNYFWNLDGVRYTSAADVTAPLLSSATVAANGTDVTLVFDEAVTRGAGYSTGHFNLDGTVTDNALVYVSGDGTSTWAMTATTTITSTTYETPNIDHGGAANSVEDGTGNDLAAIVNGSVTNNSTQVPAMLLNDGLEYADESAATTGGWTSANTPTWAYATSPAPMAGSYSLYTGPFTETATKSFTSQTDVWGYFIFSMPAISVNAYIAEIRDSGDSPQMRFYCTSGSSLKLYHGTTNTTIQAISAGTVYHVKFHYTTAGVGTIWVDTTSSFGSPDLSMTTGTSTGAVEKISLGTVSNANTAIIFDSIKLATTEGGLGL